MKSIKRNNLGFRDPIRYNTFSILGMDQPSNPPVQALSLMKSIHLGWIWARGALGSTRLLWMMMPCFINAKLLLGFQKNDDEVEGGGQDVSTLAYQPLSPSVRRY